MRIKTTACFGALLAAVAVAQGALATPALGYFALIIDGIDGGLLAVDGEMVAPVSQVGVRVPYGSSELLEWVGGAVEGQHIEKSGAVILADQNFRELERGTFANALITEVSFPAADAAAKDAAWLTVRVAGDFQEPAPSSGQHPPAAAPEGWRRDRFRFELGGLPTNVSAIGPFTVKATAAGPRPSHLVLYVAPASAQPFYEWQAAASTLPPKAGAIAYLGASGGVLATLRLQGLQMVGVGPDPGAAPPRVRVELAPEAVRLEGG